MAPNEKYLPGAVATFLEHVHAEKAKIVTVYPGNEISDVSELNHYSYYYDNENELTYYDPTVRQAGSRNKRNFRDPATSLDRLFDLPIGNESKDWYLVTNNDIEELITDKNSFIHGQNPQKENVPIYAVVSVCHSASSTFGSISASTVPTTATMQPAPLSSSVPLQSPTTVYSTPPTGPMHSFNHIENGNSRYCFYFSGFNLNSLACGSIDFFCHLF